MWWAAISSSDRALDAWVIERAGDSITVDQLYADLRLVCSQRIMVAKDKVRTTKKHKIENISSVGKGIAERVLPLINARQFPENFHLQSSAGTPIHIPRKSLHCISISPLLGEAEITVSDSDGKILYNATLDLSVAETIVRSILLGREKFLAPVDREEARAALAAFFDWFDDIRTQIDNAISESALGTGYEDLLREQVYQKLGVHPLVGQPTLPSEIALSPQKE